ncbi:MAG: ubiquinol-cytochrome c reductase iron-sulfur subunit [Ignavibacteriae bacterium]|nr:ubiquinol-cytochrome c reductase iron-sulfur subunit [Ignavibacteriota bacterium]
MTMQSRTRRDFLKGTALALGGAIVGLSEVSCVASSAPVVRVAIESNILRVETARPELFNVGDGIQLNAPELEYPILLIKTSESKFVALSTACMHLGCTVKKQPSVIRCPCHGSVYDLEGNVLNGPTQLPLHQYSLTMSGTQAVIVVD